jgi:hypothetical protein
MKIVLIGIKVWFLLTQQLMDPLNKELSRLMLQPLHHCGLDVFVLPEFTPLSTILMGQNTCLGCMEYGPAPSRGWNTVCPGQCRTHRDRCAR